jgi:hypothetical protein
MDADLLETPRQYGLLKVAGIIIAAIVILIALDGPAKSPPLSAVPPFVAGFRQAKSSCESAGATARRLGGVGHIPAADLLRGEGLYAEVKTSVDAGISDLSAGLAARSVVQGRIESELRAVEQNASRFLGWYEAQKSAGSVDAIGLDDLVKLFVQVLHEQNTLTREQIIQLRSDLEACRLLAWDKLGQ